MLLPRKTLRSFYKEKLERDIKEILNKIESDKTFNVSKAEQKLQQLLRLTGAFYLHTKATENHYNRLFTEKTAIVIKKVIYEYLLNKKDKKIKNLKKNRTGISYEYSHTVITCIISSVDGVVTVIVKREIN